MTLVVLVFCWLASVCTVNYDKASGRAVNEDALSLTNTITHTINIQRVCEATQRQSFRKTHAHKHTKILYLVL